jgi:hypothetical protein
VVRGDIAVTNLLRIQQTRPDFAWRSPGRLFCFAFPSVIQFGRGETGVAAKLSEQESRYSRAANACVIPLYDDNH